MLDNLYYFDLGNSRSKLALRKSGNWETREVPGLQGLGSFLKEVGGSKPDTRCVLASVLDNKATSAWKKALQQTFTTVVTVKEILKDHLLCDYNLDSIGEDRLANALGTIARKKTPAVIIDAGTAITVDFLQNPNHFTGGFIIAGHALEWRALAKGTARLPEIPRQDLHLNENLPRETMDAMQQGVFKTKGYGVLSLVRKEIALTNVVEKDWNMFLTGGAAGLLTPFFPDAIQAPDLMMEGMEYLWSQQ